MAKRKPSRRTEQCCYVEGGQRCRRSGTGDPTFCNPHRIVMTEASRPPKPFGSGVADLIDRVVNGRKINRRVVENAFEDVVTAWGAGQPQPPPPPEAGDAGEPWWRHAQRAAQEAARSARTARAAPPPPDPKIEERKRARKVLGFAPNETITLEMIKKKRHALARKYHPDRPGGSVEKMKTINAAADVLEASVAQA